MSSKPASRKHPKTASPLFTALAARQSESLSSSDATLLRCYIALDALRRGAGSTSVFSILAQHLILSINLCKQGYRVERFPDIRAAQQGLLRMRRQADEANSWALDEDGYHATCRALEVLKEQLSLASSAQVDTARKALVNLLETARRAA